MIYEMYKVSENSRKLQYPSLLKMFSKEESVMSIDKDEDIEEDPYFFESVNNTDKNNNLGNQEEIKETDQDVLLTDTQDGVENNQKNRVITTSQEENDTQILNTDAQIDTENNQFETNKTVSEDNDLDEAEGEMDQEFINDEDMIKIAET